MVFDDPVVTIKNRTAKTGAVQNERRWAVKRIIAAIGLGAVLGLGFVSPASAAPIDCPGGQTATKTDGGWDCVNRGGNTSNAEDPKNPNKGKGDF